MTSVRSNLASMFTALLLPVTAMAVVQSPSEIPHELEGVDIVENINVELPLDAPFIDESGNEIVLGDLPPFLPLPSPRDTQLLMMQQRPPLIFSGALATIFFPLIVISIC